MENKLSVRRGKAVEDENLRDFSKIMQEYIDAESEEAR
jgi:hypothetical protein